MIPHNAKLHRKHSETIKEKTQIILMDMLSDRLENRLDSGYATPEQRKEMEILIDAYKANGWNGDMDARIHRFYELPTKKLSNKPE